MFYIKKLIVYWLFNIVHFSKEFFFNLFIFLLFVFSFLAIDNVFYSFQINLELFYYAPFILILIWQQTFFWKNFMKYNQKIWLLNNKHVELFLVISILSLLVWFFVILEFYIFFLELNSVFLNSFWKYLSTTLIFISINVLFLQVIAIYSNFSNNHDNFGYFFLLIWTIILNFIEKTMVMIMIQTFSINQNFLKFFIIFCFFGLFVIANLLFMKKALLKISRF